MKQGVGCARCVLRWRVVRGSCLIYIWQEEKEKTEGQQCALGLAQKKKNPNQMKINNPTQQGQKQQVETGHKAEQDLGCKTLGGGGGADWKDKMVDAHVGLETEGK